MNETLSYILWELEEGYTSPEKAILLGSKEHMRRAKKQYEKTLATIEEKYGKN